MLNRTNRKLSAKNLGLDLGTRSLAVKAGANLDKLTRRCAGMMQTARVDGPYLGGSFWLGSIVIRSYQRILPPTVSPIGSSPDPRPSSFRGDGDGPTGQIAALASFLPARPTHPGSDHRRGSRTSPRSRFALGRGLAGKIETAELQPSPRNQVPDATP